MSPETTPTAPEAEDRTVALLSYLTIVGFIVALVLHSNKKTKFGAYHLRQGLGLALTFMVLHFVAGIIPFWTISYTISIAISQVLWLLYLVLVVLGLVAVSNNQTKPLPVVGELYQGWFGNLIT